MIADDPPPKGKVRTLIHELAHAQGVTYEDYPRDVADIVVETAATIVCGGEQ